jgi:hypothetical protein
MSRDEQIIWYVGQGCLLSSVIAPSFLTSICSTQFRKVSCGRSGLWGKPVGWPGEEDLGGVGRMRMLQVALVQSALLGKCAVVGLDSVYDLTRS